MLPPAMLSARFILVGVVLLTGAGCGGDDPPTDGDGDDQE